MLIDDYHVIREIGHCHGVYQGLPRALRVPVIVELGEIRSTKLITKTFDASGRLGGRASVGKYCQSNDKEPAASQAELPCIPAFVNKGESTAHCPKSVSHPRSASSSSSRARISRSSSGR